VLLFSLCLLAVRVAPAEEEEEDEKEELGTVIGIDLGTTYSW